MVRPSTSNLPPLSLSVDGIACCDCIMSFIAQPWIPSGVACQIKSVHCMTADQKLWESDGIQKGRRGQIAREGVRQCKTLQEREGRKRKVVMMGKVAGLPPISYSLYHHIVPPSSHVAAEIHRSSPCISLPSWRGQGNQKGNGFLWRKQRKACQHSCCSCTLVRRAVVLSVQCRSFTSAAAAAAGAGAGAEAGANLEQCASICVLLWVCVCACGGGGLVPPTHSAACFSSYTFLYIK